jgi:hypothetical protein
VPEIAEKLADDEAQTSSTFRASAATVFSIVFGAYYLSAYPSVTGGDAGELIMVSCQLGLAHPPGYPTFTLLGHAAVRWLPFDQPAFALNFLCLTLGAFAAMYLHMATALATHSLWCGMFASLVFSFSPTVWLYSIQGEVFALNNLLCAAMLYYTVRYYQAEQRFELAPSSETARRRLIVVAVLGAFVSGAAMTNQHTTIFYTIPTALFVTYSLFVQKQLSVRVAIYLTLAILIGFSPYLYLPLRALQRPKDSWGDQRTWAGFLHHFLRKEYGTFQLAATELAGSTTMLQRIAVYYRVLAEETLYFVPPLAVIGFFAAFR